MEAELIDKLNRIFETYNDRLEALKTISDSLNAACTKFGEVSHENEADMRSMMEYTQSLLTTTSTILDLTTRLLDQGVKDGAKVKNNLIEQLRNKV